KARYSPHLRSLLKSITEDLISTMASSPSRPSASTSARRPLASGTSASVAKPRWASARQTPRQSSFGRSRASIMTSRSLSDEPRKAKLFARRLAARQTLLELGGEMVGLGAAPGGDRAQLGGRLYQRPHQYLSARFFQCDPGI